MRVAILLVILSVSGCANYPSSVRDEMPVALVKGEEGWRIETEYRYLTYAEAKEAGANLWGRNTINPLFYPIFLVNGLCQIQGNGPIKTRYGNAYATKTWQEFISKRNELNNSSNPEK